tara:strand:- start:23631 stop:23759 length:129 start_codon:yes stop_codon:yes gene_type:complete
MKTIIIINLTLCVMVAIASILSGDFNSGWIAASGGWFVALLE